MISKYRYGINAGSTRQIIYIIDVYYERCYISRLYFVFTIICYRQLHGLGIVGRGVLAPLFYEDPPK